MTNKIPCTVGILTKNSGKTLARTLESVIDFAEIIVCDGASTDDTLSIAEKYSARIINQNKTFLDADGYIQDFSAVRNQMVEVAVHDWFFYVDSDEYASSELVDSIRKISTSRTYGAFNVFRRYVFLGKEVTCATTYPNRSMRFFSKHSSPGFRKIVHERPTLRDGVSVEALPGVLYVPVDEDRPSVWRRNDRYIALEVKRKGRVGLFKFLGYAKWEVRASIVYLVRLVRNYVFCRGVRLPLSMELARHLYTVKLLSAIWRARKHAYPPRVLFLINKWKTGGAEHVFLQENQALVTEGISTRFGAVYGNVLPPEVEESHALFPQFRNLTDIPAYVRFLSRLGDEGITHIVATLDHAMIVARIAAVFAPRVRVIVIESGMANRKPLRYKLLDLLLNWRTATVVAGSLGVRGSLLVYQRVYANKMQVLLNGVSVPIEMPLRNEPEKFTALAVGSLRNEKGFTVLLQAFKQFLTTSKANAELILIGKGPLETGLKQETRKLGIESRVRFLGELPHEEVLSWYTKVHCFVLSSNSEGNPTVVMEALAHGTPVISTRVSGVTDYIENGISGLLVSIGSSEAIRDALMRLYIDSELREKIGNGGYACAKKKLTFHEHMRELKRILHM